MLSVLEDHFLKENLIYLKKQQENPPNSNYLILFLYIFFLLRWSVGMIIIFKQSKQPW